ncbi:ATP-binding response regulator [Verrucomicrobium spinosum]|uniref:ATP-binding response regulator n=1 Tax=Verrucomicrobium spinosum TaxID=2736 RepID=UPI0009464652|nr:PAS domain-containing hybrid sensor histidine kinase/response regulator [Verrucomicrobium spinosum]
MLFACFILSCGLTHLIEATIFWHPWYRFSGMMKLVTAIVSWATVVALIKILPTAMNLPGMARLNQALTKEVSDRKASEAALQESSIRLALALEHSQLGDWSWDAANNIVAFSRRATEILGVAPDGRHSRESLRTDIHPDDREPTKLIVDAAIRTQTNYDVEYRVIRPNDGTEIWVHAKGRGVYDSRGNIISVVGTIGDATSRKHRDREREVLLVKEREARAEADRANRIKDEFLATLSHELRNPLNAILGWASILRTESSDPDELAAGLDVIERNTQLQAKLIADLLDMSRILSGKVHLDLKPTNLLSLAREGVETIRIMAEEKRITVTTPGDAPPVMVSGDSARLQQIIWNLLTNGVKFTPPGGSLDLSIICGQDRAELVVTDTGTGIDPQFLPHVFDRFRQADASSTRKYGGLGLGLSIVKHLTEMHHGTVQVFSPGVGKGATFKVTLPLLRSPAETDGELFADLSAALEECVDLTGTSVLAVDDVPDNLEVIARVLRNRGATVTTALSAAEAIKTLETTKYHVLVSDIAMPEMDGFDLIAATRRLDAQHCGHLPAIALTAFARQEDGDRALAAGFDHFLSKPVDPVELVAAICRCTGRGNHTPIGGKKTHPGPDSASHRNVAIE